VTNSAPTLKSAWDWMRSLGWIGQTLAVFGGLVTIAAGTNVLISLRKWCIEKYDAPVLHLFQERIRAARLQNTGKHIALAPMTLSTVAEAVKRSEKKTYKSLRRLEAGEKVKEVKDGWILEGQQVPPPRPHVYRL
jgi:hypothetical protein